MGGRLYANSAAIPALRATVLLTPVPATTNLGYVKLTQRLVTVQSSEAALRRRELLTQLD
jgi:hypothetical protein